MGSLRWWGKFLLLLMAGIADGLSTSPGGPSYKPRKSHSKEAPKLEPARRPYMLSDVRILGINSGISIPVSALRVASWLRNMALGDPQVLEDAARAKASMALEEESDDGEFVPMHQELRELKELVWTTCYALRAMLLDAIPPGLLDTIRTVTHWIVWLALGMGDPPPAIQQLFSYPRVGGQHAAADVAPQGARAAAAGAGQTWEEHARVLGWMQHPEKRMAEMHDCLVRLGVCRMCQEGGTPRKLQRTADPNEGCEEGAEGLDGVPKKRERDASPYARPQAAWSPRGASPSLGSAHDQQAAPVPSPRLGGAHRSQSTTSRGAPASFFSHGVSSGTSPERRDASPSSRAARSPSPPMVRGTNVAPNHEAKGRARGSWRARRVDTRRNPGVSKAVTPGTNEAGLAVSTSAEESAVGVLEALEAGLQSPMSSSFDKLWDIESSSASPSVIATLSFGELERDLMGDESRIQRVRRVAERLDAIGEKLLGALESASSQSTPKLPAYLSPSPLPARGRSAHTDSEDAGALVSEGWSPPRRGHSAADVRLGQASHEGAHHNWAQPTVPLMHWGGSPGGTPTRHRSLTPLPADDAEGAPIRKRGYAAGFAVETPMIQRRSLGAAVPRANEGVGSEARGAAAGEEEATPGPAPAVPSDQAARVLAAKKEYAYQFRLKARRHAAAMAAELAERSSPQPPLASSGRGSSSKLRSPSIGHGGRTMSPGGPRTGTGVGEWASPPSNNGSKLKSPWAGTGAPTTPLHSARYLRDRVGEGGLWGLTQEGGFAE